MCMYVYVAGLDVLWCLICLFNRSHSRGHGISLACWIVLLYNYTKMAQSLGWVLEWAVRRRWGYVIQTYCRYDLLFSISTEINTSDLSPNRE